MLFYGVIVDEGAARANYQAQNWRANNLIVLVEIYQSLQTFSKSSSQTLRKRQKRGRHFVKKGTLSRCTLFITEQILSRVAFQRTAFVIERYIQQIYTKTRQKHGTCFLFLVKYLFIPYYFQAGNVSSYLCQICGSHIRDLLIDANASITLLEK